MIRPLTCVSAILMSAVLGFAQGPPSGAPGAGNAGGRDDHNDSGAIQSGYAVVTPVVVTTGSGSSSTTTSTTGLVVFETFGLRQNGGNSPATQAGVLPPDLTTSTMLFVDSNGQLAKNLGVAIANPNSSNVNLNLTLRNSDGTTAATGTVTVQSHQQVAQMVTQLFPSPASIPANITGTLVITSAGSSSLPVSVIGLRFRGSNFSTLPATNLSGSTSPLPTIAQNVGGPGAVLLPQFAAGSGWASELVMANSGTSPMTVRVDLFKQDGTPLTATMNGQTASSFTNISIPAGGAAVLAPRDAQGNDDF